MSTDGTDLVPRTAGPVECEGHHVKGLEFAYSQAPVSMKSTVQSFWLLTTCIGNIIVIFLVSVKIGNTQVIAWFPHFLMYVRS